MKRTLFTAAFFAIWSSLPAQSGSPAWTGSAVCLLPLHPTALV
ncbi:hypothetical protein JSE7799_02771 [Jannaschia seosinensis]|uniref:Uncharacterized protein n=1 Tax=Jannaschia seosinensis TaxID=313367 RepID=A0A0M7BE29_9RHOB|nr:hypothetical protein [Jannaschia seosinensis]CUH40042.1 hypothetical protein JSE7799_02771 [Jannaschia seosinensis]